MIIREASKQRRKDEQRFITEVIAISDSSEATV
jgi:hypothetical protein